MKDDADKRPTAPVTRSGRWRQLSPPAAVPRSRLSKAHEKEPHGDGLLGGRGGEEEGEEVEEQEEGEGEEEEKESGD